MRSVATLRLAGAACVLLCWRARMLQPGQEPCHAGMPSGPDGDCGRLLLLADAAPRDPPRVPVLQAANAAPEGAPEPPLLIYEIGGGTGTLARDILVGRGACMGRPGPVWVPPGTPAAMPRWLGGRQAAGRACGLLQGQPAALSVFLRCAVLRRGRDAEHLRSHYAG